MVKCTLDIYDEVNVRFRDLDVKTRRKIVNALKFFIPHAKYLPSYKLGRWDGTKSFCTTGGRTNLNLLDFHRTEKGAEQPSILDIIISAGYDIEFNDMRTPINLDFHKIDENTFADTLWPKDHPAEGEPVKLRDYQVDVINKFLENPQCVQEIATGAGKCVTYQTLIDVKIENEDFKNFLLNKNSN